MILVRRELHKNATCYFELILEATPLKRVAVQPLNSYFKNHPSKTNKTCEALQDNQGLKHKWCSSMDPYTWEKPVLAD